MYNANRIDITANNCKNKIGLISQDFIKSKRCKISLMSPFSLPNVIMEKINLVWVSSQSVEINYFSIGCILILLSLSDFEVRKIPRNNRFSQKKEEIVQLQFKDLNCNKYFTLWIHFSIKYCSFPVKKWK